MKLNSFILPALAGVAAAAGADSAAPQQAEVYMLKHTKQTTASNPPSIPNSLAEAILLQRLSSPDKPSALGQLPQSLDEDDAISYINEFATPPRPLFDASDANEPKQLVITFSGITSKHYKQLKAAIPRVPLAFTAPSLGPLPAKVTSSCAFGPSVNPKGSESSKCWSGKTQYLHYDVSKDSKTVQQLSLNLATLKSYANEGLMETTIVFLDEDSSSLKNESDELRRRQLQIQKEAKMEDDTTTFVESTHSSSSFNNKALAGGSRRAPAPSCFASKSSTPRITRASSATAGRTVTTDDKGARHWYNWGGDICQKRDVSTPFWMFAGVTITLVATIAFSIGLLFSVGEEKLPGVIGAGVSRSK
ncbi:hypothetical protein NPX13_g8289 [Xylaria arbuscula]|uniref:Vacuolar sorting protein Vps3844 C-terminal domain-containing protein n=1 Tax=Xylaria arbuscula TaxID=114810 RepID=A0A9W8N915_9PEZI|nr:hypothetical protein NPX13_g8289 [Xylaria arbuscula]